MKRRHWEEVFRQMGQIYITGYQFTLKDLLDSGIQNIKSQIRYTQSFLCCAFVRIIVFFDTTLLLPASDISATASGEYSLEMNLSKIKHQWENMHFTLVSHYSETCYFLGSVDEVMTILEDHQITLQGERSH